ncbi:MAG TPA: hydroxymyristoyl-ACP dehydratase [Rhodanobacter sp.]|nr:hydroxymyristoyl-ACP dehydratase [Rhodanobacter sp.]
MTDFERTFCIAAEHPALPGHFPGQPLVPGVMLLEQVAQALHAWRGERLLRVLEAKFMVPLLPGQAASLQLVQARAGDARIQFRIQHDHMLLARGTVEGTA